MSLSEQLPRYQVSEAEETLPIPGRFRFQFLDMLRGVAIAGIVLVNIPDLTSLGMDLDGRSADAARSVLDFTVQGRFVPIFEFLFGVSMWFLVQGAFTRGRSPWPPMLLRMLALFGIGLLHHLVYPGEILASYAVFGLLVLPVVVLAPRWLTLGLGAALAGTVFVVAGRSLFEAPGLMLLGAGAAAYGLPMLLERGAPAVRWVFAFAVPCSALALWWQTSEPGDPRFTTAGGWAGLVLAVAYVTGLSCLWQTRVRAALTVFFVPLGRMALTNYVTASLVAAPVGVAAHFSESPSVGPALALGAAIIAAQCAFSTVWLRHFRYGPVEWLWRAVTWRTWPALRRA